MDDAINVHGTYLKIKQRLDDHTVIARYMHPQAYGFEWGVNGDEVQFVRSATMELTGGKNRVKEILPNDKDTVKGAKNIVSLLPSLWMRRLRIKKVSALKPVLVSGSYLRIMSFVTTVHAVRCSALP